jgi:hypothetical protein
MGGSIRLPWAMVRRKVAKRNRSDPPGLWLTLTNAAEQELDRRHAEDKHEAVRVAILMLATRNEFNDGDVLTAKTESAKVVPLR